MATALTVPPLDQSSVIAGHRGLTREVLWVDIMHAPAESFVRPGDLVLTTGADTRQQGVREFLTFLVSSPAAGVVLSPPPEVDARELLATLVPLADRHEFPLVFLPWEIAFAAVQRSLLSLVSARASDTQVQMTIGRREGGDAGGSDTAHAFTEHEHSVTPAASAPSSAPGGSVGPQQFAEVLRHHPLSMATILETLRPLVDYDKTRRGQLVHTLEILLDEATNTSAAARALYLNRHSLLYRIKLIEELTGLSLKNPADRFQLEVSVRVHQINERRIGGLHPTA
ncbi:PucR family transcriptional regulator [Mycobacterium antarcticum]|uniref:PucR family transcriptional regulator n=1 Tax=unclassified Mycolicibacterium TaxID=2636767 RepID=UPI0024E073F7|nr:MULTISPECIES: PucR family transcriptional regulator [unclassified Mycolicibacterium]